VAFTITSVVIKPFPNPVLFLLLLMSACRHETAESHQFTPLYDLGTSTFQGFPGGLYPEGTNEPPLSHTQAIVTQLSMLQPLNTAGMPDTSGNVVLAGFGYSTAAMTTTAAARLWEDSCSGSALRIISAAQGGMDINSMLDTPSGYWEKALEQITMLGYSAAQVQLVWLSTGDMQVYDQEFPQQALSQLEKYRKVLQLLQQHFPNLRLVWVSDRAYGGYITNKQALPLREPAAYYTSWAVKWLIEQQILEQPSFGYQDIPCIDWGPTLWTNGAIGDSKGYTWNRSDADEGGIHPTEAGKWKEGKRLFQFIVNYPGMPEWLCPSTAQ
jgi:hypothetical protein